MSRPAAPLSIACIGEAMIEVSLDGSNIALGVAGDTLNTAVYLRRALAPEHRVSFVSVIGRDALSDRIAEFVASEDIETDRIARHPRRLPGLYAITTDAAGERSFLYWRDHSAARTLFQGPDGLSFRVLEGFDLIYWSGITLAILPERARRGLLDWLTHYRAGGGKVAFDSNYRPRLWESPQDARAAISRAWGCCDIALPSLDDEELLFDEPDSALVRARLHRAGVTTGVLKRGPLGPEPLGLYDAPVPVFEPAPQVLDTTAAGDSFNGAFLAALLSGADAASAMQAGHDMACRVVGVRGAIIPRSE